MSCTIDIKTRSVNSKSLFNDINDFIKDGITDIGVRWGSDIHRNTFIEVIEDWLKEFFDKGRITQFNVICDDRNNNQQDFDSGLFRLTVTYKQKHCLNTTVIDYTVREHRNELIEELLLN